MNDNERLNEIRRRLESNAYFVNPLSDVNVRQDIEYLVGLVADRDRKIEELDKKSKALSAHAMELSQEMENIRSDFGGDQR